MNRQVKMLGGRIDDFKESCNHRAPSDSIWLQPTALTLETALQRATRLLHRKDIIPLISEYFGESMCILEYLFGNLYSFRWESIINAHSHRAYNHSADSSFIYRSGLLYETWLTKNREDVFLYKEATKEFFRLFNTTINLIQTQKKTSQNKMPHCLPYLTPDK